MRLRGLRPGEMTPDQQALYEAINSGPRGPVHVTEDGSLQGPFNALLYNPGVGAALQRVGAELRYRGALPDQAREAAIITVAARYRADFEWHAHAPLAEQHGVPPEQIERIQRGERPQLDDEIAQAAVDLARAILDLEDVDDEAYARAEFVLGAEGLVELTTLVGYYGILAVQLQLFRVPLPPGAQPAFS
jgi:4-carboxymuconolactone decarboxylase